MKLLIQKALLFVLSSFIFSINVFAADLPSDLKSFLTNKFPGIVFKIDNSFVINNEIFLPLVPKKAKKVKKIELVYLAPDKLNKITPKLFWFSNDWVFVRVIKGSEGTQTIIDLGEIPSEYKERFLNSKFPSDLVVPSNFYLKEELVALAGELPIKILEREMKERRGETANGQREKVEEKERKIEIEGILYLTSPDTGKIVYLNLNNLTMIHNIQTEGAPWEIDFDKQNKLLYITDLAKDKLYQLKSLENSFLKTFELTSMSRPRDVKVSQDGSIAYILESLTNDFIMYLPKDEKNLIKTQLPANPTSFSILKEANLIAVSCPSRNSVVFLDSNTLSRTGQIMVENGPEKVISDSTRNLVYVVNRNSNSVSIIEPNTKTIKSTIKVGQTPTSLALDQNSKFLYVGNGKSNSISIIDLDSKSVIDTINLPIETQFPGDLEITKDGKWLIVTSETTSTISIIDLAKKEVAVKLDVGVTTHAALLVESSKGS